MTVTIIGIDCATQDKKIGLALGYFDDDEAQIEQVTVGSMEASIVETVAQWIVRRSSTLIALDAPLGWPVGLDQALHSHEAGAPIQVERNKMFRRLTDRVIKRETGKLPLDVGANLIARTAHAALQLLQQLRGRTGEAIPLAWKPLVGSNTCAIEVYPAATLAAYGIEVKRKDGHIARQAILGFLQKQINLPHDTTLMKSNDDALDAAICVLAGVDFMRGKVIEPTDIQVAKKEGWIWVRKPN